MVKLYSKIASLFISVSLLALKILQLGSKKILTLVLFLFLSNYLFSQTNFNAWYSFNGNANDLSGNGHNGVVTGAILDTDRYNRVFSSYKFNGINNKIIIPLNQTDIKEYSISFWFKSTVGGMVITGRESASQKGFSAVIQNLLTGGDNVGKAMYVIDSAGTSIGKISNLTYLDGNWHNYVGTYLGSTYNSLLPVNSNDFSIYIDGVLISQSNTNTGIASLQNFSSINLIIGGGNIDQYYFNGSIDDIGIWGRVLNANEIRNLSKFGPAIISSVEAGNKKNTINWVASVDTAVKKYKIFRSTSAIPDSSNVAEIATITDVTKNSYIDSVSLTNGVRYFYRMKYVFSGDSVGLFFGNQISSMPNFVDIPSNFVFNNDKSSPKSNSLSWDKPFATRKFQILRSTDNINKVIVVDTLSAYSYSDTSISRNTTYYYWIRAIDSIGAYSDYSAYKISTPTNIWYVSPSGNNSNIGSASSPKLTIANSIINSAIGDTIILNRGTYKEAVDLNGKVSLLSSMYILTRDTADISNTIISGANNGNTSLIVSANGYFSTDHHIYALTLDSVRLEVINLNSGNHYIKLSKSIIKNSGNINSYVINMSSYGILDSCTVYNLKGVHIVSMGASFSPGPTLTNCTFYNNNTGSNYDGHNIINISPHAKVKVINNLIYKNTSSGIGLQGFSNDSLIVLNNTITLNTGNGISLYLPGEGVYLGTIVNNLSIFNSQLDLFASSGIKGAGMYIKNNFFGGTGSLYNTGILSVNNTLYDTTGNIGGDPHFVDTLNNNYRLSAYSNAIGQGFAFGDLLAKDIEGNIRVNSWRSNPDIGAFESSYKFSSPFITKGEPSNKKTILTYIQSPKTNIVNYKIYRSAISISDTSTLTQLATIDSSKLSYIDSVGLTNNTKYYYRVKSVYSDNSISGFSNQITSIPNIVDTIKNITISNSPNIAKFTWSIPSVVNNKFQIFRSIDSINKTLLVDTLSINYYSDPSLVRNTKYYYWLRAIDSTGAYSNYSSAITLNPTNSWYVDSAIGNDTTGYGTLLSPYKKLQKAIDISIGSDTILVKSGTYIENLLINKKTTIISQDGALKTSIKPLLPNSQIVNFTSGALDSKIKGFKLFNGGNVRGSAIDCNFSNPIIENCIITNSAGEAPIRFYYSAARITNCLIYKNTANNVFFYDPNDYVPTITHSTIAYNVGIGTGASNSINIPIFTNSIIYGNTGGSYSGNINILNSIVQGGYPGNSTNIDANPKFADSLNNNFHLSNYSPAIGIGKKAITETKDFDLNNRILPTGSFPDAGAYENINDHPAPYLTDSTTSTQIKITNYQYPTTGLSKIYIYKGFVSAPTSKSDSISIVNSYTDTANKTLNKYIYYRFTSIGAGFNESGYSNEIKTILFTKPSLLLPNNKSYNNDTSIKFIWSKNENAIQYKLQYSLDSTFTSNVVQKIANDTSIALGGFKTNSNYYWRVLATDTVYVSPWSSVNKLQTFIAKPILDSIKSVYKNLYLYWTNKDTANTKYVKIYRDSLGATNKLIDSIAGNQLSYKDSKNLTLNQKYFYRIKFGNYDNIESDSSNVLNTTAVNTLPKASKLVNKTYQNAGEYNFIKLSFSANSSYDVDGSIASYNWYINDSLVNRTDSLLSYFFKLGTNTVKLVVIDNDGGKDSSSALVTLSTVQKQFLAGILGGISAINQNYILTADTSFNSITGSSVSLLDRLGNTILPIIVQSKIFTTPSISSDSSIFITNGSSLNGYSKAGVSLWPTIPLGGISYVTPTIDSNLSRIYVGISNKNFFAYDYKTGKNAWSIICDAPINSSAVISGDRKLIFTSQSGTLYGFDISKSDVQTTPKWKMSFGDIVTKSPAVDASSNIYVGTDAGRLIKFQLNTDGTVTVRWNVTLSSSIQTSPVIDADSNIYVGTEKGDFYKINRSNGTTIWSYNVGAAIHSTPNISEYGTIYVANMNGLVTAITTDKRVLWKYQDVASISANSLYINNMLYVASEKGTFTGIYDNPNSVNVNTSITGLGNSQQSNFGSLASFNNIRNTSLLDYYANIYNATNIDVASSTSTIIAKPPVWGTFQGDYRRTGSLSIVCPSTISITKDSTGNLIANNPYIQWYKDGIAITNSGAPTYKPSIAGSYSVKNNQVGCNSIASNSYYYIVTDVINLNIDEFIKLSPNPFNDKVNIEFKLNKYQKLNLEIYNLATGNIVASKQGAYSGSPVYLGELSGGIYLIKLTTDDLKFNYTFKMVKP